MRQRGSVRTAVAALLLALGCTGIGLAAEAVINASDVGPDLPPQGRSLFDTLVYTQTAAEPAQLQLPFPFSALLGRLRERLGVAPNAPDPFTAVLLPVGRSLQRHAAAPEFFRSPRVVAAVTGDAGAVTAPLARDRLYIGYQEQTGVLEIISYNAALGRFEFQIVKDYRAEAEPQLYYAKRMICMACHQNQAPIFSRPLWSETNANPAIAARLRAAAQQDDYDGIPFVRSIDAPDTIDNATDRSNLLAVWQSLWQDGCARLGAAARRCRTQLLDAALQLRLSGWRGATLSALEATRRAWQDGWPNGLALPNPDIPNRDPLADDSAGILGAHGVAVTADVDPLLLREPSGSLRFDSDNALAALVQGLAEFFSAAQIEHLDARLLKAGGAESSREHRADCSARRKLDAAQTGRIDVQCVSAPDMTASARLYFQRGRFVRGSLDRLQLAQETLVDIELQVPPATTPTLAEPILRLRPVTGRLSARRATGQLMSALELRGLQQADSAVSMLLRERDDYVLIRRVLEDMQTPAAPAADVLADAPFQAALVMRALDAGLGVRVAPAVAPSLPPAQLEAYRNLEVEPGRLSDPALAGVFATLQRYCAACHASAESFPPNFLSGPPETVQANLTQCAERIDYRLAMWSLTAAERDKSPMPPALLVSDAAALNADPAWLRLREYISTLRATRSGSTAQRGYEQLAPCLDQGG